VINVQAVCHNSLVESLESAREKSSIVQFLLVVISYSGCSVGGEVGEIQSLSPPIMHPISLAHAEYLKLGMDQSGIFRREDLSRLWREIEGRIALLNRIVVCGPVGVADSPTLASAISGYCEACGVNAFCSFSRADARVDLGVLGQVMASSPRPLVYSKQAKFRISGLD